MQDRFTQFIKDELECIKEACCIKVGDSVEELNIKALEWVAKNAPRFRAEWNRDHALSGSEKDQ
jgi:hypothetical protein